MNDKLKLNIESLKEEIDLLRPFDEILEGRIMQKFRLDWNFNSNNIEGNSLSYGETKAFLLHGLTASGKPLKDHLDIKGHNEALLYIEDIVKEARPLSETFIRSIHEMILGDRYQVDAITSEGNPTKKWIEVGEYKSTANHVKTKTGETFYFASPEETPAKMTELVDWERSAEDSMYIPLLAAKFHYRFVRIHPFDDGNGRMARILMNLILMKHGYPPAVVKTTEKEKYFAALQQADGGNLEIFEDYIAELVLDSLDIVKRATDGADISEMDDFDKEIKLFKAENHFEKPIIQYGKNSIEPAYLLVIEPILSHFLKRLNQINDFFSFSSHDLVTVLIPELGIAATHSQHVFDSKVIEMLKSEAIESLNVTSSWMNLIGSKEDERFTMETYLTLNTNGFSFGIDDNRIAESLYNETGFKQAIQLVDKSFSMLLSDIKLLG